jgi:hypothetical protein
MPLRRIVSKKTFEIFIQVLNLEEITEVQVFPSNRKIGKLL